MGAVAGCAGGGAGALACGGVVVVGAAVVVVVGVIVRVRREVGAGGCAGVVAEAGRAGGEGGWLRAGGTELGLRVRTVLKPSMEAKDGWSGPCEGFGPRAGGRK